MGSNRMQPGCTVRAHLKTRTGAVWELSRAVMLDVRGQPQLRYLSFITVEPLH